MMSTDLDTYQPAAVEPYQARMVMTPADAKALDDQLRACTVAVLREGTDYGVIPHTDGKLRLFKPGAEKLLQWFGLFYTMECIGAERNDDGTKQGVTYRCVIVRKLAEGVPLAIAACEGYAGYDEDKFYQSAEAAQSKAEARERKWAATDGRPANPNKWKHITDYRAPWNTIVKMAQKRALVGAVIAATAAGGLFGEEEAQDPVADDGSSWYEQAIERAHTFTDIEEGRALYVEATQAHRDGLCLRRHQDHVQNTVVKRVRKLQAATPVDVEDLADRAEAGHAQDAAEDSQDAGPGRADDEGREPPEDALPAADPPDWPEVTRPGTGTPKGK